MKPRQQKFMKSVLNRDQTTWSGVEISGMLIVVVVAEVEMWGAVKCMAVPIHFGTFDTKQAPSCVRAQQLRGTEIWGVVGKNPEHFLPSTC